MSSIGSVSILKSKTVSKMQRLGYAAAMENLTTAAIRLVLGSHTTSRTVHVSDLVAALRSMVPGVDHDETTVLELLTMMVSEGYVPPVAVVADY